MGKLLCSVVIFSLLVLSAGICISLEGKDIVTLKKAGLSDETIQLMVREKTVETCSFTVQEILDFKKAGLSDKTIQVLIKDGAFVTRRKPIIYGEDTKPIRFVTKKDIIDLKKAGVSDEIIQAIIIYGSKDADDVDREKAWNMLRDMDILIDRRK